MIEGTIDTHIASKFCMTWIKLIDHKVGDHITINISSGNYAPINTLGRFDVVEFIDVHGPYIRIEWNLDSYFKKRSGSAYK